MAEVGLVERRLAQGGAVGAGTGEAQQGKHYELRDPMLHGVSSAQDARWHWLDQEE
jgi:hypothetical protein